MDVDVRSTGRQQVASLLVIYGPRMTALLCVCGRTYELIVNSDGFSHVIGTPTIKEDGAKIFSPANLRAAQDLPAYASLIQTWMKKRYTLRYTGEYGFCRHFTGATHCWGQSFNII